MSNIREFKQRLSFDLYLSLKTSMATLSNKDAFIDFASYTVGAVDMVDAAVAVYESMEACNDEN